MNQNKNEAAAEETPCSFCGYMRPELERIDNGLKEDEDGYGFGDFCTVCRNTKGISAFFMPWEFRLDLEMIRTMCQIENKRLDDAAEFRSHLQYIRTMTNENNNTICALVKKLQTLEERLGRH